MSSPFGVPILVCEGARHSIDIRLLIQVFSQNILFVVPAGGIKGLGAVAEYLRADNPTRPAFYVEDRDFRNIDEAEATYYPEWRKYGFMWRRHEIENYLLDPPIIAQALNIEESRVVEILTMVARNIRADQAGRRAQFLLNKQLREGSTFSFDINTPHDRPEEEWRRLLREKAEVLLHDFRTFAEGRPPFGRNGVEEEYQRCLDKFSSEEFFIRRDFLRDFGGKEFIAFLHKMCREVYHLEIPLLQITFQEQLLKTFLHLYVHNIYRPHPDDFHDLLDAIKRRLA